METKPDLMLRRMPTGRCSVDTVCWRMAIAVSRCLFLRLAKWRLSTVQPVCGVLAADSLSLLSVKTAFQMIKPSTIKVCLSTFSTSETELLCFLSVLVRVLLL